MHQIPQRLWLKRKYCFFLSMFKMLTLTQLDNLLIQCHFILPLKTGWVLYIFESYNFTLICNSWFRCENQFRFLNLLHLSIHLDLTISLQVLNLVLNLVDSFNLLRFTWTWLLVCRLEQGEKIEPDSPPFLNF